MADGSSWTTVKAALIAALGQRSGLSTITVSDGGPVRREDAQSSTGKDEAIWLGDATWSQYEVPFVGTPVTIDETYDIDCVIQVEKLGPDADTQTAADTRINALLGEVLGTCLNAPDLAIAPGSGVTVFEILPYVNDQHGGWMGKGDEHGSRLELKLRVKARLAIT